MDYRLFLEAGIVDDLLALSKIKRTNLIRQFEVIRANPAAQSDFVEYDQSGRRIEVCIFSGLAIHYRDDLADRHIKILKISTAD